MRILVSFNFTEKFRFIRKKEIKEDKEDETEKGIDGVVAINGGWIGVGTDELSTMLEDASGA